MINELTMEACTCPGMSTRFRQEVRHHVSRMAGDVSSFLRALEIR